jgi:initiation factor 1A
MPRTKGFVPREEGTQYGRVLRNLGHMNLLVYCNDGKQRICHIRGAMRKRVWVNVGDIVLVSSREYEIGMSKEAGEEKGDVLHKYDTSDQARLRADAGFNPALLLRLELQSDLSKLAVHAAAAAAAGGAAAAASSYMFDEEGEEEEGEATAEGKERAKTEKSRAEEARRVAGLQKKTEGLVDDDVDIDAI